MSSSDRPLEKSDLNQEVGVQSSSGSIDPLGTGIDLNGQPRLRATSRAMMLLRRAATNLRATSATSVGADSTGQPNTGHILRRHLFGKTRSATKSQSVESQLSRASADSLASESNRSSTPSQFIVPKTNALKLPIACRIRSLEGELMREVFVHRYELGQYLLDSLRVGLGFEDAKYFGLKLAKSPDDQEDLRTRWLDLGESVFKQVRSHLLQKNQPSGHPFCTGGSKVFKSDSGATSSTSVQMTQITGNTRSVDLYLRIRFYPPNMSRVQDPFLRQYLWLQLRRDLRLGKLTSSVNNLTYLMACVLQHDLGDFRSELLGPQLAQLNILPNQDLIEEQAVALWRTQLTGSQCHQAQMQFLRAAVILETYGFDYYPVRDHQRQRAYLLGFNYAGVKTIKNGRIAHHFRWHSITKISYERRMIIFHVFPSENSKIRTITKRKQIIGFKCVTNDDCLALYMKLLEQKYFFTVDLTYFDKSIHRPSFGIQSESDCPNDPIGAEFWWHEASSESQMDRCRLGQCQATRETTTDQVSPRFGSSPIESHTATLGTSESVHEALDRPLEQQEKHNNTRQREGQQEAIYRKMPNWQPMLTSSLSAPDNLELCARVKEIWPARSLRMGLVWIDRNITRSTAAKLSLLIVSISLALRLTDLLTNFFIGMLNIGSQ